jgi:DNA uptake protein ComE-like DNA-binding protein
MQGRVIAERTDAEHDTIEGFSYLLACVAAFAAAIIFSFGVLRKADVPVVQLQTRINPNEAPAASLIRLPQIGMTRAEKIIAYRQANAGDEPVFTCFDDLRKVKGIGPAIAGQLADYLRFERTEDR